MGICLCLFFVIALSCKKIEDHLPTHSYKQTNLVADVQSYNPMHIDKNLLNAWGIAVAPSGPVWISANHSGLTTIYDKTGATLLAPVSIPGQGHTAGAPTGVVFNSTADFIIPSTTIKARFIFAGEDGIISAWGGGPMASIAANRGSGAVYKGIELANDGTSNFLYAANFHKAKIDVYDKNFKPVSDKLFSDPTIPKGFAPFNIKSLNGYLYVTYAKQKGPDEDDDQAGPGNGYVNIFTTKGVLVKRFASQGALNSPWGMVWTMSGFCDVDNAIIIGNFGDGRINVYDEWGHFKGQLKNQSDGQPITIEGLWALDNSPAIASEKQIYFTAGPGEEEHGIFGVLERQNKLDMK